VGELTHPDIFQYSKAVDPRIKTAVEEDNTEKK
jgi:hypothetical protein